MINNGTLSVRHFRTASDHVACRESWEGPGRVLGGSWEVSGRVLKPGVTDSRLQDPTPGPSRDHTRSRCLSLNGLSFSVVVSFFFGLRDRTEGKKYSKKHSKIPTKPINLLLVHSQRHVPACPLREKFPPLDFFRADAAHRLPLDPARARPKWLPKVPKVLSRLAQTQHPIFCHNFDDNGGKNRSFSVK